MLLYCKECGTEIGDAKFCPECGTSTSHELTNNTKKTEKDSGEGLLLEIDSYWLIIAIFFPVIGVIGSIYFAFKNKRGAGRLLLASIIIWIIWAFIYIMPWI